MIRGSTLLAASLTYPTPLRVRLTECYDGAVATDGVPSMDIDEAPEPTLGDEEPLSALGRSIALLVFLLGLLPFFGVGSLSSLSSAPTVSASSAEVG